MYTMYFCLEDHEPVIRCWHAIPRVGDTVSLAELDDTGATYKVMDVLWEGDDEPTLSIHLNRADGLLRRIIQTATKPTPCNAD